MDAPTFREMLGILAALVTLLAVRAVTAGLEAALVAVGLPRAQELAQAPGAGRRARALAGLLSDPEATAFTLRFAGTFSVLFAGVIAGTAGAKIVPGALAWAAAPRVAHGAGAAARGLAALARDVGARHGEALALAFAPPFRALSRLVAPVGRFVTVVTGKRARFALPRPPLDEMERALAEYARASGGPQGAATSELIHAVFEFREKVARDVMVPRTEVVALDIDTPVPDIIRILAEEGHSRLPVYRGSLDQIAGVLHARDLVPLLAHPEVIALADLLRPAHFIPWSKPVDQLLREMQRKKLHMVFVVDEFGGVMGICTIEDVLEEIVGEIQDEFDDEGEGKGVEAHGDGTFSVQGATPVAEFNQVAGADVPEGEGYETVAGFINTLAGAIPSRGDRFFWRGWVFTVADADPRKVTKVRAARVKRA